MSQLCTLPNSLPTQHRKRREADRYWPVLRDLIEARAVFGLKRPVLATLRALISFLEEGHVVFASNRSIASRAEGVSESSLRRHIRALIDCGLLRRQDSSNGKRYRIEADEGEDLTFGLDLSPLAAAAPHISDVAERVREENRLVRYLRKKLGQLIYQARSLGRSEEDMQAYQKALRQKLSASQFDQLCQQIEGDFTSKMTGSGSQNDWHKNKPEERLLDIRKPDQIETDELSEEITAFSQETSSHDQRHIETASEAQLLKKAQALAPDALSWAPTPPRNEAELEALAWQLASWSGIGPKLLGSSIQQTGKQLTTLAILTIAQHASRIRNPGAYFRAITLGARQPRFARVLAQH